MPIIKDKIINIVVMKFSGTINQTVTGFIEVLIQEAQPLIICKNHIIQNFHLGLEISQKRLWGRQISKILVSLLAQVSNQLLLQVRLGLILTRLF